MGFCDGLIAQSIQPDCENPIVGGLEKRGVIINFSDLDKTKVVFNSTSKNIVESLGLTTKAYDVVVSGSQPFNGTTTTFETGTNRNTFTNAVGITILDNDPDVCENVIDGLANGKFIVILENNYKNKTGNSAYQIFGFFQGLKATTIENDKYSEDTDGGWNVVLTETKAPKSALFYFDTDLATTKAKIESLTAI